MSVDWDLLVENHLNKGEKKMSLGLLMESINEVLAEVGELKGPKLDLRTPLNEEKQVAITFPGLPDIPLTEIGWSKLNTEEGGEIKGAGRTMLEAYLKNVPGKDLSEKIAKQFGIELGNVNFSHYSDGEFQPSFEESVRGARLFIIGSTQPSSENLMELLLMVDAAKRSSARHITAVVPYFGWARQDRKDKPRVPIGAKLIANLIEAAGATRIITMDLHADQIQGFFEKPVDHLYASTIFIPYIQSLKLRKLTIASPDMGGSKRAYAYSRFLKSNVVICYKQRKKANVVSHMELIGKVEGKNVIIVDDMVDTAGTLCKAADLMMERGAESVRAICTHALLSGNAYENIEKSKLKELIVTDSIPQQKKSDKVKVLTCSKLFADVMHNVNSNKSINSFFIK